MNTETIKKVGTKFCPEKNAFIDREGKEKSLFQHYAEKCEAEGERQAFHYLFSWFSKTYSPTPQKEEEK